MKKALFITSSGALKRYQNSLRFESEDKKRPIPIETTSEIHVFGELDINTRVLNFLTQHHIPLHVYNYYGYYAGSYMPREQYVSGFLTLQQASHYTTFRKRLELAQAFVVGGLKNIEKVLMYYERRKDSADFSTPLEDLRDAIDLAPDQNDINTLMALEGNARQAYYKTWDDILKSKDFTFGGRSKRPPKNQLNALISFGNSLMYVTCLSEIHKTHLDARIGFLHTTNYRRYSLNLDLAEIFKPIIVDRVIFSLINQNMLNTKHFKKEGGGIFLKEKGRDIFLKAYDAKLKDTLKIPRLKRHVSYRRLIRMECYKLEKHLIDDEPYRAYVARS